MIFNSFKKNERVKSFVHIWVIMPVAQTPRLFLDTIDLCAAQQRYLLVCLNLMGKYGPKFWEEYDLAGTFY